MREMTMQPRRSTNAELLERLCMYRRLYARRSAYDAESVLSVDGAIAYGEALLLYARRRDPWKPRAA
jgi:hypothetical protein